MSAAAGPAGSALLGDSAARDYGAKLARFSACAAPELAQLVASLELTEGMRVVDAGCGTGEVLGLLAASAGPAGCAVGMDLSAAHAHAAAAAGRLAVQADLLRAPLPAGQFDLVWSLNTINHVRRQDVAVAALCGLLRPGGRLALAQSHFLPEMFFAWDARLERLVTEAVRAYYRERYGVSETELGGLRALVGLMRAGGLREVRARTVLIERVSPLDPATAAYLQESVFEQTWGERLRPYLAAADFEALRRLCDPADAACALKRTDFHFLQSLTLVLGTAA